MFSKRFLSKVVHSLIRHARAVATPRFFPEHPRLVLPDQVAPWVDPVELPIFPICGCVFPLSAVLFFAPLAAGLWSPIPVQVCIARPSPLPVPSPSATARAIPTPHQRRCEGPMCPRPGRCFNHAGGVTIEDILPACPRHNQTPAALLAAHPSVTSGTWARSSVTPEHDCRGGATDFLLCRSSSPDFCPGPFGALDEPSGGLAVLAGDFLSAHPQVDPPFLP